MELEAARRHSKTIPHPFPSLQPWNWKWWKRLRDTNEGSRFEEQRRHGLPPVSWFFVSNTSARVLATVSILLRVVVKRSRSSRTRSQWPRWWASSAGRERSIFRCRESWATLLLATFHVAARRPFTAARSSLLDLRGPSPAAFFFFLFFPKWSSSMRRCDSTRSARVPRQSATFFLFFFLHTSVFFWFFFRWRCSTLSLTTSTSIGHRPRPVKGSGERFSFPPPFMSSIEVNVSIINQGGPPASSSSSRSRRVSGSDRVTISAMQFPSKGLVNERIFRVSWSVFFVMSMSSKEKPIRCSIGFSPEKVNRSNKFLFLNTQEFNLGSLVKVVPDWCSAGWEPIRFQPIFQPENQSINPWFHQPTAPRRSLIGSRRFLFEAQLPFGPSFTDFFYDFFFYWDSLIVQNYYSRNTHLF